MKVDHLFNHQKYVDKSTELEKLTLCYLILLLQDS